MTAVSYNYLYICNCHSLQFTPRAVFSELLTESYWSKVVEIIVFAHIVFVSINIRICTIIRQERNFIAH